MLFQSEHRQISILLKRLTPDLGLGTRASQFIKKIRISALTIQLGQIPLQILILVLEAHLLPAVAGLSGAEVRAEAGRKKDIFNYFAISERQVSGFLQRSCL